MTSSAVRLALERRAPILRPKVTVYGVQARGAAAIHDSWHAGTRLATLASLRWPGLAMRCHRAKDEQAAFRRWRFETGQAGADAR
jgi:hypothetical protein